MHARRSPGPLQSKTCSSVDQTTCSACTSTAMKLRSRRQAANTQCNCRCVCLALPAAAMQWARRAAQARQEGGVSSVPAPRVACHHTAQPTSDHDAQPPSLPATASNQTWGLDNPAYCNLPIDTALCLPATGISDPENDFFEPAEQRLTLEQYQALKKNPSDTSVLDFLQWGTCMERGEALALADLPECGEPGGPCSAGLCNAANLTCPDG